MKRVHQQQYNSEKLSHNFADFNSGSQKALRNDQGILLQSSMKHHSLQKINLQIEKEQQQSPILAIAISCGMKDNRNQVISDLAQNIDWKARLTKYIQTKSGKNSNEKPLVRNKPSFLHFKAGQIAQKQKLFKIFNLKPETLDNSSFSHVKSQIKKQSTIDTFKSERPMPKQLIKLKGILHKLPQLTNIFEKRIITCESTPNANKIINRMASKQQHKQSSPLQSLRNVNSRGINGQRVKKDKLQYCKKVKNILDMSTNRINVKRQQSQEEDLNEFYGEGTKKSEKLPKYPDKNSKEKDANKIEINRINMKDRFQRYRIKILNKIQREVNFQEKIKQNIRLQQSSLNTELIERQRDYLGKKYLRILQTEKSNYEHNLAELAKWRQQSKMSRQMEQIWANGIKRVRKQKFNRVSNNNKKYSLTTPKSNQQ